MAYLRFWIGTQGPFLYDPAALFGYKRDLSPTIFQAPFVFENELGELIPVNVELNSIATDKEDSSNKVTSWGSPTTDTHYPSEKLVKDSLDDKEPNLPDTPTTPEDKFLDGNRSWQSFPVFTIPSAYVEMVTPVGTISATLEDVTGATVNITLPASSHIAVDVAFEVQTQSGASSSSIAIAVNIDGTDHDEMERYLSGSNDKGLGAIVHRTSTPLAAGTYTVKLRFRRVSGVATPGINKAHLKVIGLMAYLA